MDSTTPPSKRIRLESSPTPPCTAQRPNATSKLAEDDNCSICLQQVVDRTVIPTCSHEFCFECLLVWSGQQFSCSLVNHTRYLRFLGLCRRTISELSPLFTTFRQT